MIEWREMTLRDGPVKVRRILHINGQKAPFAVDTDRIGSLHVARNALTKTEPDGTTQVILRGSVETLKRRAEALATETHHVDQPQRRRARAHSQWLSLFGDRSSRNAP